jgi:hypothetical protein
MECHQYYLGGKILINAAGILYTTTFKLLIKFKLEESNATTLLPQHQRRQAHRPQQRAMGTRRADLPLHGRTVSITSDAPSAIFMT